jgi:sialate O-acetylesterase
MICSFTLDAIADVRLPNVWGNHMVLQREKPVTVWGWAEAGERITVTFAGQEVTVTAKDSGEWNVRLTPLETSFVGRELACSGETTSVTISDVLVGEVWLCGGQSNMEWSLRASRDADVEIPSADSPAIRFLRMPHVARPEPQTDFPISKSDDDGRDWKRCVPEEVENCTGVGYYFARRLHRRLKCPIGLIDTSWGGTMAQHWVSTGTLQRIDEVKPYFETFHEQLKTWEDGGGEEGASKRYEVDFKTWEADRDVAKAAGEREPRRPNLAAYENPAHKRQPGGMFNGMIVPISDFTLRGVLFYQGENNSFTVGWKPFPKTFPAVFSDWRAAFGDPQLPIGIIQIAGWSNRRSMTYDMNHHTNIVREIQHLTWQRTPNTGLVVTFDTNSNGSIHPARKLPVGERSARWALAEVYRATAFGSNKPLEWRGPVYESTKIDDGKILVTFEEGTDRGLRLDQDAALGFCIAGDDREFHIAQARITIDGDKKPHVVIWSDKVPNPVATRYAWSNLPLGSLMNLRELPAYPFRTDEWPLVPHQSIGEYRIRRLSE